MLHVPWGTASYSPDIYHGSDILLSAWSKKKKKKGEIHSVSLRQSEMSKPDFDKGWADRWGIGMWSRHRREAFAPGRRV